MKCPPQNMYLTKCNFYFQLKLKLLIYLFPKKFFWAILFRQENLRWVRERFARGWHFSFWDIYFKGKSRLKTFQPSCKSEFWFKHESNGLYSWWTFSHIMIAEWHKNTMIGVHLDTSSEPTLCTGLMQGIKQATATL